MPTTNKYYKKHRKRLLALAKVKYQYDADQDFEWRLKRRGLPAPSRPMPLVCESCGRLPNGSGKRLHYDHDHTTNRFRGWLCSSCNTSIGGLGDTQEGLLKALDYLRRTQ